MRPRAPGWLAITLCGVVLHAAIAAPRLTMVSSDFPPYHSATLPGEGFVTVLVKAAFRKMGYDIDVKFLPWARLIAELKAGRYDGGFTFWRSTEREAWLAFSDPVYGSQIGFFSQAQAPRNVADLAQLKSLTIGTVRGYANPARFDAAQLHQEEVTDDLTNLRKLAAGRLDLVLIDHDVAQYLIRHDLPEAMHQITWLEPAVDVTSLYVVFSKQRPNYARNRDVFNQGLAALKRSGEFERILQSYRAGAMPER